MVCLSSDEMFDGAPDSKFEFPLALREAGRAQMLRAFESSTHMIDHVYVVRSFGRGAVFRNLTCGLLESLLPSLDRCVLALTEDDPDIHVYKNNAGPWADRIVWGVLGAERQIAFIDQIAPVGNKVMIFDDNIASFRDCGQILRGGLDDLIACGFKHMEDVGAKVWSANKVPNPKEWGSTKDRSWRKNVGVGLGLVHGAAFGMVATHEMRRYSRFGQVMDDTERSCRFYEHDGVTVRLRSFQIYKPLAPGLHSPGKGGISASLTAEEHAKEGAIARVALVKRFPHLLEPSESKLGVKFKGCTD